MSRLKSVDRHLDNWREKYLAQSEEFEREQKSYEDYIHLIHRVLVRVSLAADGCEPTLDKELSGLRTMLRKAKPSVSELNRRLVNIETVLKQTDHNHQLTEGTGLEVLSKLVEQLRSLGLNRGNIKNLDRIAGALQKNKVRLEHFPELLDAYAKIQLAAFQNILQPELESNSNGWLARMFIHARKENGGAHKLSESAETNRGNAEEEGANGIAKQQISGEGRRELKAKVDPLVSGQESPLSAEIIALQATSPDVPQSQALSNHQEPLKNLEQVVESDSEARATDDIQLEGGGAEEHQGNLDKIRGILRDLLDQLQLPEAEARNAEGIVTELGMSLSEPDLVELLDDLTGLLVRSFETAQMDFELFLQSLDERLGEIHEFVDDSDTIETQWREANTSLGKEMREHMSGIGEDIDNSTDIGSLKESVQNRVTHLVVAMDTMKDATRERESALDEQLVALKERLTVMEDESFAIRKRLQAERVKALTDVLTGLPNREGLDERLQLEWNRFQRYRKPISVAILDVDHFKKINDTHGHLVGDRVLQSISGQISSVLRKTDFFARFGGEEFVVLMPETDAKGAERAINILLESVANAQFSQLPSDSRVTVSAGFVQFETGESIDVLLERADQALYQAKANGRNRVEQYSKGG